MALGSTEIEHRFGFHKATIEGENATLPKHRDTRLKFREFAEFLDGILPEGRAKSVMFTELETASMWAHKAIAETAPAIAEDPTPDTTAYVRVKAIPEGAEVDGPVIGTVHVETNDVDAVRDAIAEALRP